MPPRRKFHSFPALPIELQVIIWKYAFAAEDKHGWRRELAQYEGASTTRQLFIHPLSPGKNFYYNYGSVVMTSCRLAKFICLQEWRKVVEEAQPETPGHCRAFGIVAAGFGIVPSGQAETKEMALKVFDGLLEQLQAMMDITVFTDWDDMAPT